MIESKTRENAFLKELKEKMMAKTNVDVLDQETIRDVERMVILRVSTKHVKLWIRQLEMRRKEIGELAGLLKLDEIKKEIEREKSLESWAKRTSNHFTRKVKRMLFEEIDNMVWSGREKEVSGWCRQNKVYDEITDDEILEIWRCESPDESEAIRLNGKYVWDVAKRVCSFINAHDDLIHITTFGEYREVMLKVMKVIKEAHNVERKRRQTKRKERSDAATARTQRAKALISRIKQGRIGREEIEKTVQDIFGKGSHQEIEKAKTDDKIVERIEEMSKAEHQFEEWERMRREEKKRQREDRRLNLFWRRNKTFPGSLEVMRKPRVPKKRLTSGGASTTRRSAKDGKRTGTSEEPFTK